MRVWTQRRFFLFIIKSDGYNQLDFQVGEIKIEHGASISLKDLDLNDLVNDLAIQGFTCVIYADMEDNIHVHVSENDVYEDAHSVIERNIEEAFAESDPGYLNQGEPF